MLAASASALLRVLLIAGVCCACVPRASASNNGTWSSLTVPTNGTSDTPPSNGTSANNGTAALQKLWWVSQSSPQRLHGAGCGTFQKPCDTLDEAFRLAVTAVQQAGCEASGSDEMDEDEDEPAESSGCNVELTIIVDRGVYYMPSTVKLAGSVRWHLSGAGDSVSSVRCASRNRMFELLDSAELHVSHLEFRDCDILKKPKQGDSDERGGVFLCGDSSKLFISHCAFHNNTATFSSVAWMEGPSQLTIWDSEFTKCKARDYGGVIGIQYEAIARLFDSRFVNNSVIATWGYGGVLFADGYYGEQSFPTSHGSTPLLIHNCSFINNTAIAPSGVAGALFSWRLCVITACTFHYNRADFAGALYMSPSYWGTRKAVMENCTFVANNAKQKEGSLGYMDSTILSNSLILDHGNVAVSSGGWLFVLSCLVRHCSSLLVSDAWWYDEPTTITATTFEASSIGIVRTPLALHNLTVTDVDCGRYSTGCLIRHEPYPYELQFVPKDMASLEITNTVIRNVRAGSGAVMVSTSTSAGRVLITNSTFSNIHSTVLGGAFLISQKLDMTITNSTFDTIGAQRGGVVWVEKFGEVQIRVLGSVFQNNWADIAGGVIGMLSYPDVANSLVLGWNATTVLRNNSAPRGGCVFASNRASVNISNARFEGNSATYGGVVYFDSNSDARLRLLPGSSFVSNYANKTGGVVYVTATLKDAELRELGANAHFLNNRARYYGPEISTPPFKGDIVTQLHLPCVAGEGGRNATTGTLCIASGTTLPTIKYALQDQLGQELNDADVRVLVFARCQPACIVKGQFTAEGSGSVNFSQLALVGSPGSEVSLQLEEVAPAYRNIDALKIRFHHCRQGEYHDAANSVCVPCVAGQFSISIDQGCTPCPKFAVCPGQGRIGPQEGYWPAGNLTTTPFYAPCPNPRACRGLDNSTDQSIVNNGNLTSDEQRLVCAEGYTGRLCASCARGYGHSDRIHCAKCPNEAFSTLVMSAVLIIGILVALLIVQRQRSQGLKPRDMITQAGKIFMSYCQLVAVANSLNTSWPDQISQMLEFQRSLGSGGTQIAFLECFLQNRGLRADIFFIASIYILALPTMLVLIVLAWLGVAVYRAVRTGWQNLTREYLEALQFATVTDILVTSIVILFLLYPTVTYKIIQIFACLPVIPEPQLYEKSLVSFLSDNPAFYLVADAQVNCYDEHHNWWMFNVGIPALIVIVIGIPAVAMLLLWRIRKQLDDPMIGVKFGFLYRGYSADCYYWEVVLLARKTAVIMSIQLLAIFGSTVQIAAGQSVVFIMFALHIWAQPYVSKQLDLLERVSLMLTFSMFSIGAFLASTRATEPLHIAMSVLAVLINVVFAFYTAYVVHVDVVRTMRKMAVMTRRSTRLAVKSLSEYSSRRSSSSSALGQSSASMSSQSLQAGRTATFEEAVSAARSSDRARALLEMGRNGRVKLATTTPPPTTTELVTLADLTQLAAESPVPQGPGNPNAFPPRRRRSLVQTDAHGNFGMTNPLSRSRADMGRRASTEGLTPEQR